MRRLLILLALIGFCEAIGLVGSIFTFASVSTWYPTLNKPFFIPPSWLFGPVWTTLFALMGISLFLVWGKKKTNLNWFWTQIVLNVLWSLTFFGLKSPLLGMVVIILLGYSIFQTAKSFEKINKVAAYLLYPYLAWVSFASLLNLGILVLNV